MNFEIYEKLRERILYLDYEPGSILKEQQLAKEFNVSRTPLRTVLFRLEWDHLLKVLPRTGIQVAEIELNRIMNVYQARLELEYITGRMAARQFTDDHYKRLSELRTNIDALTDQKAPEKMARLDFASKALFNEAAGNPYLTETSERLYALTFRLWYFNMLKMNDADWSNEVLAVKSELSDLTTVLNQKDATAVGDTRKKHLLKHLERIRTQFFSLS